MNRVVVTGLGCITPIGNSIADFRTSLFNGATGIAPFPPYPEAPGAPHGFRFTQSSYDASAAALGLASGHVWRVQGAMRLAGNYFWGGVLVTPSITGLAYDDVDVTGQVVTGGQFNAAPIIPLDQGKVRGQGILALNFDYGTGVSTYVSGEVHGGSNLFGAGGKVGIRYQW